MSGGGSIFRRVARKAFCVVRSFLGYHIAMGVMAGNAADSGIGSVEAFAVREPVRLEAHIELSSPAASYHRFPRPVTLPAKI